jgi:hypothetical protein
MAAIIYTLWMREGQSLLIMPGTLPLNANSVRIELLRCPPEGWSAILWTNENQYIQSPLFL